MYPLNLLKLREGLRLQADYYADKAVANSRDAGPHGDAAAMTIMNGTTSLILYALVIALQEAELKPRMQDEDEGATDMDTIMSILTTTAIALFIFFQIATTIGFAWFCFVWFMNLVHVIF